MLKEKEKGGVMANLHSQPFYYPDHFDLENQLSIL